MNSKLLLGLLPVLLLLPAQAFAQEESPIITITFVSGDVIDLDENPQMIRADVEIQHYNPQNGYHYMEILRLSDNEIIKNTEIFPKIIGGEVSDNLYGVQILHYLEPDANEENLIGDYGLRIYSEFGPAEAVSTFSVIKSSMPVITTENTIEELVAPEEETTDEVEETETEILEEPKIPSWVHDIFVWYADEVISEDELLAALEYLISQGTINVDST